MIKYKCETCLFEFEVSFDDEVAICPICANEQKGFYEFAQLNDPKVFWEKVLNKYNAEYDGSIIKINTCRRKCIYEDEDYIKALELASDELKEKYLEEAKKISSQEKEMFKKIIIEVVNNYFEEVIKSGQKIYDIYRNQIHFDKSALIHWEKVYLNNTKTESDDVLPIWSLETVLDGIYRKNGIIEKTV